MSRERKAGERPLLAHLASQVDFQSLVTPAKHYCRDLGTTAPHNALIPDFLASDEYTIKASGRYCICWHGGGAAILLCYNNIIITAYHLYHSGIFLEALWCFPGHL